MDVAASCARDRPACGQDPPEPRGERSDQAVELDPGEGPLVVSVLGAWESSGERACQALSVRPGDRRCGAVLAVERGEQQVPGADLRVPKAGSSHRRRGATRVGVAVDLPAARRAVLLRLDRQPRQAVAAATDPRP